VVADRSSTDRTVEVAELHPLKPSVVYRRGLGPGAARNLGVAAASGSVLGFTDADCVPARDWLAQGLKAARDVDIVQGVVRPMPGRIICPFDRTLAVVSEYGLYETANLFVARKVFDRLGGFVDLAFSGDRPFGEDSLFVWRARRDGASVGFTHRALVHHAVFPGTRSTYLAERTRQRLFPALVELIPELRRAFLYKRLFLSPRTAAFDAMLLSVVIARLTGSLSPLAATLPYGRILSREMRRRPPGCRVGQADLLLTSVAADAVSLLSLLVGSASARVPVL
jgi:glycosyltransferase involved in cell wall biosynthesis